MLKKLFRKASSVLYRTHLFIDKKLKQYSSFKPYQLNYQPSESKLKVIHFNGNFVVGGSSQLIVDIIERTSGNFSHKIVVPQHPDPIPYQPVSIYQFPVSKMEQLYTFLEEEKPHLVHIHYWIRHAHRFIEEAFWYKGVFDICEELGLKVIQNINVPTKPYLSNTTVHKIYVSSYVLENFDDHNNLPATVIYPGSNFSHFRNDDIASLPAKAIGMIYRLERDKLNEQAIEVFIQAVKLMPDITCYIIGGGSLLERYKTRVQEEGLKDNFVFTGYVSYTALPQFYKKFSVFVAPVHDESFGQVSPFAMSMGLNIAGYDTGALSEILGYKDTLVEYGKTKELAAVIVDLLKNPEKRLKYSKQNQKRAHAKFSVEHMISQYENIYQQYVS